MAQETRLVFRVANEALVAAAEKHLGLRDLIGGGITELEGIARMLLGTMCEGSSVVDLSIHGYSGGEARAVSITFTGQPSDVATYAKAFQELLT